MKSDPAPDVRSLLMANYHQALYKANISFYKTTISGLLLFKYNKKVNEYNVVILSEVGLNIMEFKYSEGKSELVSCKSFIDKPSAIETLKADIGLLIEAIPVQNYTYYTGKDSLSVLKNITGKRRLYYLQDAKQVVKVLSKEKALMPVVVTATDYSNGIPKDINIKHKRIKLSIELQLLNKKD